jgi:phospholipid-binding lipoprotein MlaA
MLNYQKTAVLIASLLMGSCLLGGCANSSAKNRVDPWQGWNRKTQKFNDDVDAAILKPLARGYQKIAPVAVDEGVTNFFNNINDINVFINDFLQLKFKQGGMDGSRFVLNTTFGMAGMFDIASTVDFPKHNEDFGQTLGFWGIPSGPYWVIPLFGASSPRDAVGLVGDALLDPLTYISLFGGVYTNVAILGSEVVDVTDRRAGLMATEKIINEGAVDRYEFIKSTYQQRREYLIHDGHPLDENSFEEDSNDVSAGLTQAAPVVNNSVALPLNHHR